MTAWKTRALDVRTKLLAVFAAMFAIASTTTLAQDAAPPNAAAEEEVLEEVIVTGTSRARIALDTPLSATTFGADEIARLSSSSQADILNSVPTIKAEGGGGEVASNVFIKGLPSGGQYQFTPLLYDGFTTLSSFGLNSSAYDVYYRNDLGIERLEFVRGGVSNLFGPGSVAGLINYISKTGSANPERTLQLELAEEDRIRADFALSGPINDTLFYAVSGFYRDDAGPIETGNDTKGFQLRGNLKKTFADNAGKITVYAQYIDDQAQFYLPFPLDGQTRSRVAGNDGRTVFSVQTSQVAGLGFATPDGPFVTSITDGVVTEGGSLGLDFEFEFANGWALSSKLRYADYDHSFDFFLDGDGIINRPETQAGFVTNRSATIMGVPTYTYADNGQALAANALLFANRFVDRDRPAEDLTAEFNVKKSLEAGSAEHTITVGAFFGNAKAQDFNVTTAYLADFNNEARLVNLSVNNAGVITNFTRSGLFNAGAGYVNNEHEATRYAVYAADQIDAGRWVFDIGARFEKIDGDISRERTATTITDATTPNLSAALRDVTWGTDVFTTGKVDTSEWAAAFGALYKLTDSVSLYGNAARGFFFPELRSVQFNAQFQPQSYEPEIIEQGELGVKFAGDRVTASIAALYTELNDRRAVEFVNDGQGGIVERVNIVSTESYGIDAALKFRVTDSFSIDANATWQEHEYTAFDTRAANIGNELIRQPNVLWNLGIAYDDGKIDFSLASNHTGTTFTSETNAIQLDSFDVMRANVGYTFDWNDTEARVSLDVYNLLDDDGVTEGSPRQDTAQTTGGAFFVGRPVLPRRVSLKFAVNF
jgi:iron complex outermembrane recepter protein